MQRRRLPQLSFSTLACPEWTPEVIIARGAALGYDGIEWRGGSDGHVSTTWPTERRRQFRENVDRAGLSSLAITSYAEFTSGVASVRDHNAAQQLDPLQLAADVGAPFVRTFLGSNRDGTTEEDLVDRVARPLSALAPVAKSLGVAIVVEQHDDFVRGERVRAVLESVDQEAVGAVWDIGNAWAAGEDPLTSFNELAPWIRYVQVKDGVGVGDSWRLTALGSGEIPIGRVLSLARNDMPICVEWERAWHPELAPADEALPQAAAFVRRMIALNDSVHESP
jgi:sugar phosphate isomerase/epimerase